MAREMLDLVRDPERPVRPEADAAVNALRAVLPLLPDRFTLHACKDCLRVRKGCFHACAACIEPCRQPVPAWKQGLHACAVCLQTRQRLRR